MGGGEKPSVTMQMLRWMMAKGLSSPSNVFCKYLHCICSGGYKGAPGTRPPHPNSFISMQFWPKNRLAHPLWKLTPPQQEVKPNANGTGNPGDVICKVGAHEQNGRTTREMYKINCNFRNNS